MKLTPGPVLKQAKRHVLLSWFINLVWFIPVNLRTSDKNLFNPLLEFSLPKLSWLCDLFAGLRKKTVEDYTVANLKAGLFDKTLFYLITETQQLLNMFLTLLR